MDRRVTPLKWVNSPSWAPPPPWGEQALKLNALTRLSSCLFAMRSDGPSSQRFVLRTLDRKLWHATAKKRCQCLITNDRSIKAMNPPFLCWKNHNLSHSNIIVFQLRSLHTLFLLRFYWSSSVRHVHGIWDMELPLSIYSRSSFGQRFTKHGINDCMYAKHTTGPSRFFFLVNTFILISLLLE